VLERAATRKRIAEGKDVERLKFSILRGVGSETERISWTDTEEQPLKVRLSTIAVEIIVSGEMQYREHQVWVYEEAIRRREEMNQEAIRRQIEQEKAERERLITLEAARLKRLTDSAENYHRAQPIRAFVASVISASKECADPKHSGLWKGMDASPGSSTRPDCYRTDLG